MKEYRVNIEFDTMNDNAALRSMMLIVNATSVPHATICAERLVRSILTVWPEIKYLSASQR